jgi:hypothetical protein
MYNNWSWNYHKACKNNTDIVITQNNQLKCTIIYSKKGSVTSEPVLRFKSTGILACKYKLLSVVCFWFAHSVYVAFVLLSEILMDMRPYPLLKIWLL